jgi:hypothetical protein
MHIHEMNNHNILAMSVLLLTILVLMFQTQTNLFFRQTFGLLPIPGLSNHTPSISIHTLKTIQANNFNIIKQEEAAVRKAVLSDIDHVIFIAKGSAKTTIPISVDATIINQMTNSRTDTTQGVNMTKSLVATELANAINTIIANSKLASQNGQQPTKVVVDNQATCSGIATPTSAACSFTIAIHG